MQSRTTAHMTQTDLSSLAVRGVRSAAWLALPVLAVALLRTFPPLELGSHGALAALLAPLSAAVLALSGGIATLIALARGFRRTGHAGDLFAAAGLGALAAGGAAVALAGPDAASAFPTAVLPVALAAAGLALLAGEVMPPARLTDRFLRLLSVALVFGWIELPVAVGLLGRGLADLTAPIEASGGVLLAIAAVTTAVGTGDGSRAAWLGGLAVGAVALAVSRTGTLDLLPPMLALVAACGIACAVPPVGREDDEEPLLRPIPLIGTKDGAQRLSEVIRDDEFLRLARELRGTIAELLAARQTLDLQRDELERLRTVDPLTGVATRGAILGRLHLEVAGTRRYTHPCAVLLVDLDGMVGLNRDRGREVGDSVLRELALRLRLRVRDADGVGRTDGDSFLCLLPHTDERGATVFAEAVRSRLTARPVETEGGPVSMTVSIGITIVRPGDQLAEDEVLGRAEEALASARAAGGNRIAFDRSHGLARLEERRTPETDAIGQEGDKADAQ